MSMIVNGVDIPKNCGECPAGTYEYNVNDERCFVCGFIKSQHPWECEHAEIDGIDTNKMRAYFCPIAEVDTPHWIPVTERLPEIGEYVLCAVKQKYRGRFHVCKYVDKDKYRNHPYFDWWHNGFPNVIAWMPIPEVYKGEQINV